MGAHALTLDLPTPSEARLIRVRAGLSQEKFAALIGCSSKTIGEWEHGRAVPSDLLRHRYIAALDSLQRELS